MSDEILSIVELEKFFPPALSGWRTLLAPFTPLTVAALRGVSFGMNRGEAVALVGPNGAGKSTLLRILTTLLLPTRGRVTLGGADVQRDPAGVRQQLGFHSGSDASFYARLTARENLLLFSSLNNLPHGEAQRRITQLGELLGLETILERQVRTLSTGNVHRLGLARALLHRPSVLILDEPTRSLDPIAASEFRRFLRQEMVQKQGTTLLFSSHTLGEVEELADRMALLNAGRLLAYDTPARVRSLTGSQTLEHAVETLVHRAGPAS